MGQQTLNNGESLGLFRGKSNSNFTELYSTKLESSQVLIKTNTTPFSPTDDYHPSTKIYVDGKVTDLTNMYDPQSIGGDAFARANHTGVQDADTITQDTNHRMVTDTDVSNWNGKEDAIGTKGTAFNKNYGTTSGTTATGDHTHTKGEIGLGSVDNTSDLAKPISTAQAAVNASKADVESLDVLGFDTAVSAPTHLAGRVFYDSVHDALSYYNAASDVTVNLGQEMLARAYNDTGITIPNASVVRYSGAIDPTTLVAKIVLAQANNFTNSKFLGVTTHDVLDTSVGFTTTSGIVHDVNTSGFSSGDLLYLSDTTPGALTNVAPDIISVVGRVIKIGTTDGAIYVNPISNVALPTTFAELEDVAASPTLTTSYQTISGYTSSESIVDIPDTTSGEITPQGTGEYRVTGNLTASFTSSATGTRIITLQVWDNTNSVSKYESVIAVPKDSAQASRSFSKLVDVVAGTDYVLRIKADSTFASFVYDSISFDMVSVNARA